MKKLISLIMAALLALSTLTATFAATYTDKDTVKKVQQALNDAGYECGTPDGIAGKKTAAAITQYRTDKGLEVSDTIDDALLEAMGLAEVPAEAKVEPEQAEADSPSEEGTVPSQSTDITEDTTITPELLYAPQAFMTAWQNLLYNTGLEVFAEIGAEAIAEKWANDYYDFEAEDFDLYSVPTAWTAKLHFSFDVDAEKIGTEQPEGIMMMFTGRTENMLDAWDCLAAKAFLYCANFLYGGSEEDWNSLYNLFGDTTPESKLSTEDWKNAEDPVYECEKYGVYYRNLGLWSANEIGFSVCPL